MKNFYKKCEDVFAVFAEVVYTRKYTFLLLLSLFTLALASQLANITIDTRDEGFFHADDPALVTYNDFKERFGQDEIFIVALQPENGLDTKFFQTLYELHQELEEKVPYLDEITSLVNGRVVWADGDTLHVEDLLESPPQDDQDLRRIHSLIDHFPMFDNLLVSKDRSTAAIVIKALAIKNSEPMGLLEGFEETPGEEIPDAEKYLSNAESLEITKAIQAVVAKHQRQGLSILLTGTPAVVAELQMSIERDLSLIVPLSLLMIILFLTLLYRRLSGVVYPLLVVILSLVATFGFMGLCGLPITLVNQILPSFLLIVGIGDTVHILTIFYRNYDKSGDKRQAIIDAVGFAGLPVLMTSVTTAAGLFSFSWADVATIAQLGYIAPVGVMVAFVYTLILLPVLIALVPIRQRKAAKLSKNSAVDLFFTWIARVTTRRPMVVALVFGILVSLSFMSALTVKFSHNVSTWFPEQSAIRQATNLLDSVNGGSVMLESLIDTGKENGLHDPAFLGRLDNAVTEIAAMEVAGIKAGKVWALPDVLKETHRALNEDRANAYKLPASQDLVAQELILFEASGSDDLEDFSDSTYQVGRLSILAPFADAVLYVEYIDHLRSYLEEKFPEASITLTGKIKLFVGIISNALTTMAKSYSFAIIVITLLMIILVGRVRVGLMSMFANVVPIICILGIMGINKIPLDLSTMLVGSLVLGIVVDDTIHFLHHFRRAFDDTGDIEQAVKETLCTTGRALFITSMVLCGGFFIYIVAYLANNVRFGIVSGSAVIFALVADFFLVPALLSLVYGHQKNRRGAAHDPL